MARAPKDVTAADGGAAMRLIPDECLRELQARAVALQHLSTRLHDGDGFSREEGDDLYLALTWLAEGLVNRIMEVSQRWDAATGGAEAGR